MTRFGRRVTLKKGDRLELQHVKVVVEKPEFEDPRRNSRPSISIPRRLRQYYQEDIPPGRTPAG